MARVVRAAVMPAPNVPLEMRELAMPELGPGAAVLRTLYSEVCGTDVHLHHGRLAGVPYPLVPGHVSVGHLEDVSGAILDLDGTSFREGDLVGFLDVHGTCGNCYQCLVTRQSTRCPHRRVYGITYGAKDGPLGGWADRIWIKPGVKLLRIPASVDPLKYIAGGCGLVTSVHAIERSGLRLGQSVAVLGVGPVGQAAIALAAMAGAYPIMAIGGPADRLALARRMGATHTLSLDTPSADRAAEARVLTGGHGVDVVIEVAGAPAAVPQALDLARDGGVVVIAGQDTDGGAVALNPHAQINRKHVEIRGCWGSDYSHFHHALQLLAHQGAAFPWLDAISAHYPLKRANEALAAVANRAVVKAVIAPS